MVVILAKTVAPVRGMMEREWNSQKWCFFVKNSGTSRSSCISFVKSSYQLKLFMIWMILSRQVYYGIYIMTLTLGQWHHNIDIMTLTSYIDIMTLKLWWWHHIIDITSLTSWHWHYDNDIMTLTVWRWHHIIYIMKFTLWRWHHERYIRTLTLWWWHHKIYIMTLTLWQWQHWPHT